MLLFIGGGCSILRLFTLFFCGGLLCVFEIGAGIKKEAVLRWHGGSGRDGVQGVYGRDTGDDAGT